MYNNIHSYSFIRPKVVIKRTVDKQEGLRTEERRLVLSTMTFVRG